MGKKNFPKEKSRPFNLISISVFSFRGMRVIVEGRRFSIAILHLLEVVLIQVLNSCITCNSSEKGQLYEKL